MLCCKWIDYWRVKDMAIIIDPCLSKFRIPVQIENDCDYYQTLISILDKYYDHISTICNLGSETIHDVAINIEIIKEAIQNYFKGNICVAKLLIQDLIKAYLDEDFFVSEFDKSYAFRGIAPLKEQQKKFGYDVAYKELYKAMNIVPISMFRGRISKMNLEIKDMLHIPFNLREKVSTERYSMSGIPCLYLATTTLGCYLELGAPKYDTLYLSSFKVNNSKMKLLNLCITQHTINGAAAGYVENYEIPHILNLIKIFPLVIASSFVVNNNPTRSFKAEYIIPQLIMMSINELGIESVAYLSVHMPDFYAYPQCVNIAVPMVQNNFFNKYSEQLQYFTLTEPVCFSSCLLDHCRPTTKSYINKFYDAGPHSVIELNKNCTNYVNTDFGKADDIIIAQPHLSCPIKGL